MVIELVLGGVLGLALEPDEAPSPAEAAVRTSLAILEAQPNGAALANYTLCWITERASNHPYYSTLRPTEVFPGTDRLYVEIDQETERFGQIEYTDLRDAAEAELERRDLLVPCNRLLVPDPVALRIIADRAEYRRGAMMGITNPAEDYRDFVDAQIEAFLDQPNADQLLRLSACLAYTDPHERHSLDLPTPGAIAADPEQFHAQTEPLIEVQNRFFMVQDMYDMDQIWQQALAEHTPLPICEECVALYEQYSPTYAASRQGDGDT